MNNAITSILMGKLNALNSWRNSLHGKLSDCVETGEGASNQLQGSSKFDAPALTSVLNTEMDIGITTIELSYNPKTKARPERNRSGQ